MRIKLQKLSILFLLVFGFSGIQAQENINTTGGNGSGNGGSVSYSIGQVVYETHTGNNGSLAEGVQQPYEISLVTAVEKGIQPAPWAAAYPNPTTDKLTLKVNNLKLSKTSFQLYDMTGKILLNGKVPGNQTSIVVGNLMPGIYFLKVIREGNEVKIFKIIKR